MFIIDECDDMLDTWFIEDIKKICSYISMTCQIVLISATINKNMIE